MSRAQAHNRLQVNSSINNTCCGSAFNALTLCAFVQVSRFGNWKDLARFCEFIQSFSNAVATPDNHSTSIAASQSTRVANVRRLPRKSVSCGDESDYSLSDFENKKQDQESDYEEPESDFKIHKTRRQYSKSCSRARSEPLKKESAKRRSHRRAKRASSVNSPNLSATIMQRARDLSIALPSKFRRWRLQSKNNLAAFRRF